MSASNPAGFTHRTTMLPTASAPTPAPAPAGPGVPIYGHLAQPGAPRRAAIVKTAEQATADAAAARRIAMQPDPAMAAWVAQARAQIEDGRHRSASVVNSDAVADAPRNLW